MFDCDVVKASSSIFVGFAVAETVVVNDKISIKNVYHKYQIELQTMN